MSLAVCDLERKGFRASHVTFSGSLVASEAKSKTKDPKTRPFNRLPVIKANQLQNIVSLIHFCSFFLSSRMSFRGAEIGWQSIKKLFYATVAIER